MVLHKSYFIILRNEFLLRLQAFMKTQLYHNFNFSPSFSFSLIMVISSPPFELFDLGQEDKVRATNDKKIWIYDWNAEYNTSHL